MPAPFDYNPAIPSTTSDPGDDQPIIQTNFASTSDLIGIDHVTFNNSAGGEHLKITFNGNNVPGGTPADPVSAVATQAGIATTSPNVVQKNSKGIFPLSCIRAFGSIQTGASPTFPNSFNVQSVTFGGGIYTITLAPNATTGDNATVLITGRGVNGTFQNFTANVITVIAPVTAGNLINFTVLQA